MATMSLVACKKDEVSPTKRVIFQFTEGSGSYFLKYETPDGTTTKSVHLGATLQFYVKPLDSVKMNCSDSLSSPMRMEVAEHLEYGGSNVKDVPKIVYDRTDSVHTFTYENK